MAARGLITLFRSINPKLLHRKDRGRPTEATKVLIQLFNLLLLDMRVERYEGMQKSLTLWGIEPSTL